MGEHMAKEVVTGVALFSGGSTITYTSPDFWFKVAGLALTFVGIVVTIYGLHQSSKRMALDTEIKNEDKRRNDIEERKLAILERQHGSNQDASETKEP